MIQIIEDERTVVVDFNLCQILVVFHNLSQDLTSCEFKQLHNSQGFKLSNKGQ